MTQKIAFCGLICQDCPIRQLSLESDEAKREKIRFEIAQLCQELYGYGLEFMPENINDCDSCHTKNGRLFSGCEKCEIRKCAIQKRLENCAYCNEYACEKLNKFFVNDPDAKARLDIIRITLENN